MMSIERPLKILFTAFGFLFWALGSVDPACARIKRFKPREGEAVEVCRITNDPTVRDHANYQKAEDAPR